MRRGGMRFCFFDFGLSDKMASEIVFSLLKYSALQHSRPYENCHHRCCSFSLVLLCHRERPLSIVAKKNFC